MAALRWNKNAALEQTGGDEELLDELFALFRSSSAADVEALAKAVQEVDAHGVFQAAHSLKGAAASLGIESICSLATAMENDARAGSVEKARMGLGQMKALLAQLAGM
ncbi:MAG: histidine phosphotransferase [Desulfobulbus propionicus]|nr:MAG: histidine phosphotransferase [Desulfobulbus propionicus]